MKDYIELYMTFLDHQRARLGGNVDATRSCLQAISPETRQSLNEAGTFDRDVVNKEAADAGIASDVLVSVLEALARWREDVINIAAQGAVSSGSETIVDEDGVEHLRLRNS